MNGCFQANILAVAAIPPRYWLQLGTDLNNKLVEELIRTCRPSTKLCIASNITCEDEFIQTRPIKSWAGQVPDLSKKPTIFLLFK